MSPCGGSGALTWVSRASVAAQARLPLGRVVGIRLLGASEAIEVVDDARGGALQQRWRAGVRVWRVEEGVELGLREVGDEAGQRVAFHGRGQRLAHDGGAHHHAERVEGDLGPVAVRVAHEARLQDAVVVCVDRDAVAERVAGFDHQQVVGVEVDEGVLAERVAVAARQEEVLPGLRQLGGGADRRGWR